MPRKGLRDAHRANLTLRRARHGLPIERYDIDPALIAEILAVDEWSLRFTTASPSVSWYHSKRASSSRALCSLARLDFDQFANDLEALGLRKASQGLPLGFKAEPGAALAGSAHAEVGDQGSSTRPLPLAAQPGRILQRPEENSHSVLEKSWFRLALIQTTRCVPMRAIRHQHRQPI